MKKLISAILVFVIILSGSLSSFVPTTSVSASPFRSEGSSVIFQDNFENELKSGWHIGTNNPDQRTTWGITDYRSYSKSHSFWCAGENRHLTGHYSHYYYDNMKAWAELENLDFRSYSQITLEFYYWIGVERNYDFLEVDVRDQNGQWHGIKRYSESSNGQWKKDVLDLSQFKGEKGVILQFVFVSDYNNAGGEKYEGAYIDDVKLVGKTEEEIRGNISEINIPEYWRYNEWFNVKVKVNNNSEGEHDFKVCLDKSGPIENYIEAYRNQLCKEINVSGRSYSFVEFKLKWTGAAANFSLKFNLFDQSNNLMDSKNTNSIHHYPAPHIISINSSQDISPGNLITINGKHFDTIQNSYDKVVFPNDLEGDIVSWSENKIRVRVPDNAKSGNVVVKTRYGTSNEYYINVAEHRDFLPDLIVENITLSNTSPKEGDTVHIDARVKNIGNTDAYSSQGNIGLKVFVDNIEKKEDFSVHSISSNTSVTMRVLDWVAKAGSHKIKVVIDPENKIREIREDNNTLSININVEREKVERKIKITKVIPNKSVPFSLDVEIEGEVLENGKPASNASVGVQDPIKQISIRIYTNANGKFIYTTDTPQKSGIYEFIFDPQLESQTILELPISVRCSNCQTMNLSNISMKSGVVKNEGEITNNITNIFSIKNPDSPVPKPTFEDVKDFLLYKTSLGVPLYSIGEFVKNPVNDVAVVTAVVSCPTPETGASVAACGASLTYVVKAALTSALKGKIKWVIDVAYKNGAITEGKRESIKLRIDEGSLQISVLGFSLGHGVLFNAASLAWNVLDVAAKQDGSNAWEFLIKAGKDKFVLLTMKEAKAATESGDSYENDNTCSNAKVISTDGTPQQHTINPKGDVDWIKFSAENGYKYTIETFDLEGECDTVIALYRDCNSSRISQDDDGGVGRASKIVWSCTSSGTYYVKMRDYSSSKGGPNVKYKVKITKERVEQKKADLTVENIWRDPSNPTEGDSVTFIARIKNIGEGNADTFNVELLIDGNPIHTEPVASLSKGESTNVTFTKNWTATSGCHDAKVIADSTNWVDESNENNNTKTVQICPKEKPQGDSYENDNTCSNAKVISTDGTPQQHTINPKGDVDWIKFSAENGYKYTIETFDLEGECDTVIALYRDCNSSRISQDDDGGVGRASKIVWSCTSSGTYYVKMRDYSSSKGGPNVKYKVKITKERVEQKKADLTVENIWRDPSNPTEGDSVTFIARIKNIGEGNADTFNVELLIDGNPIHTEPVASLSKGESTNVTFTKNWTATSGCHDAKVIADSTNWVDESNENNNTKTVQICPKEKQNLSVHIWVGKGCGSTYKLGEHIKIYGKSNVTTDATYIVKRPDGTWTHTMHLTANQNVLLAEGDLSGPTGQRTYTLRVTANGQTKEDSCSINVIQGESQFNVNIWVDKNCGSTYCLDDPIRIFFKSNRSGTATITDKTPDGKSNTLGPWNIIAGKTYYLDGKITPPTGYETLVLKVVDSNSNSATDQCTFIVQDCNSENCQISMQPPQNMEGKACCYISQHTYDLGAKYDIQELYIKWKTGWCTGCDGPTTFSVSHDLQEWRTIGTAHGIGHQWTEITFHNLTAVRYIRISCPDTYVDDSYICVRGATPSTNVQILAPNIYLYPEKQEKINVSLSPEKEIVKSYPLYPPNGWNVTAEPKGIIDGKYNYLFYEAKVPYLWHIRTGWIIKKDDFTQKMPQILANIGLNKREIKDFVDYWSVHLPDSKYYLFSPLDESLIDKAIELNITPEPDTIRRIWFGVVLLDKPINIPKPFVEPIVRKGFTVVEWGLCFVRKEFVEDPDDSVTVLTYNPSQLPNGINTSSKNLYDKCEQKQFLLDFQKVGYYKPVNFSVLAQIHEHLYRLKLFGSDFAINNLLIKYVMLIKHLFSRE